MALLTLCSDGYSSSDQVFTVELTTPDAIVLFVELVKHGGIAAGLVKPSVIIDNNGKSQTASARNDWQVDRALLS